MYPWKFPWKVCSKNLSSSNACQPPTFFSSSVAQFRLAVAAPSLRLPAAFRSSPTQAPRRRRLSPMQASSSSRQTIRTNSTPLFFACSPITLIASNSPLSPVPLLPSTSLGPPSPRFTPPFSNKLTKSFVTNFLQLPPQSSKARRRPWYQSLLPANGSTEAASLKPRPHFRSA